MQQLDQVVLEDDLAGGRRNVLADFKSIGIRHPDRQLAFPALKILQQVLQTVHEIVAMGLHGNPKHFRVGHQEICRCHRIDKLPRIKIDLLLGLLIKPLGVSYEVLCPA